MLRGELHTLLDTPKSLSRAAKALRLRSDGSNRVRGIIDGIRVEAALVEQRLSAIDRGPATPSSTARCTAWLRPPLRLGLEVGPKQRFLFPQQPSVLAERIGPDFASALAVSALEPDAANELLRGSLGATLAHMKRSGAVPYLTDRKLRCDVSALWNDDLVAAIRQTVALARDVLDQRARLAPTQTEELIQRSWRPLCAELGGRLDVRRLEMEFRLEDFALSASIAPLVESQEPTLTQPRRHRIYWATRFDLRSTSPLVPRLEIVETGRAASSRSPIVLDDEAFDRAFIVYAKSIHDVRMVLNDAARRALLALRASVWRLELRGRRLRVEIDEPLTDEARLRQLIELLQTAARTIAQTRVPRGPYR